jgi:acetamidase/formamidase
VCARAATQIDPADVDKSGIVAPSVVADYTRAIFRDVKDRGPGFHILTGPIFVKGAMPGDVLEVRIQEIDLAVGYEYNVHRPNSRGIAEFPNNFQRVIAIDRDAKTAQVAPGVVIPLTDPFFGRPTTLHPV